MASPLSHPLVTQLQTSPTVDPNARQAAILAINAMMKGATKAGLLLNQAKDAAYQAAASKSNVDLQRAQQAAQEAYKQRTNAEVAKFRAAYSILAENEAEKSVSMTQAANSARDAASKRILVQKANYHATRRDQMVQAANATSAALKLIPPVDPALAPPPQTARNGQNLYRATEATNRPSFNWRPSSYRTVQNTMFPADIRAAAGAMSGLGDDTVNQSTGSSFMTALETSLSKGIAAAGTAAASQGNAMAGSNPTGGLALAGGGNLLNALSQILGMSQQQAVSSSASTGVSSWLPTVAIIGALGVGGYALYKFIS